jgi:ABC-type microcin C transport system permease subunit YejE
MRSIAKLVGICIGSFLGGMVVGLTKGNYTDNIIQYSILPMLYIILLFIVLRISTFFILDFIKEYNKK